MTVPHDDRVDEVLVQVIDVLDHPPLGAAADSDIVEHGQVADELAQPDATRYIDGVISTDTGG